MGKGNKGNHSKLTWQDLYHNGVIDEWNEVFCEDSQTIHRVKSSDGWDTYKNCAKMESGDSDDWILKLKNGEIKRIL